MNVSSFKNVCKFTQFWRKGKISRTKMNNIPHNMIEMLFIINNINVF